MARGANDDTVPDGTDIWVPRTHDHAKAVVGTAATVGGTMATPTVHRYRGIYRPASGGANYDDCCSDTWSQAMNLDDMASYTGRLTSAGRPRAVVRAPSRQPAQRTT